MTDRPDSPRPDSEIVPAEPKTAGFDEKIGRAIEKYGSNSLARALLVALAAVAQNVHGFGQYAVLAGIFDFITSNRAQEIGAQRTQRLVESVAREVASVRGGMIRADYFQSEAWHDLFRRALEANVRVSDDKRRDAIARIIVAAASGNSPPAAEAEGLVAVLGEMTENEAALLGILWAEQQRSRRPFQLRYQWESEVLPPDLAPQGEFLLRRLLGRGLLVEDRQIKASERADSLSEQTFEKFTPTGTALMRYLEVNPPA